MAKSDLLKQAIADANAVKETALANAKIALQEAFAPRIQSMLGEKLRMELEGDEDEMDVTADDTMDMGADVDADMDVDMDADMEGEMGDMGTDVGDLSIDVNGDGEFDEFDIMSREEVPAAGEPAMEPEMSDADMADEYEEEDDLELWESVQYRMDEEGFDYCFESYSNWDEIKDEEFHRLRLDFLRSMKELREYINKKVDEKAWDGE